MSDQPAASPADPGPPLTPAELVVAATVGTARRPVDVHRLPEPLRPVTDPTSDPAVALLDAAALVALAHRARPPRPVRAGRDPEAPPAERRPEMPPVLRTVLTRLHQHTDAVVEALTLIDRAGLRLPADLVPRYLDDARPAVVAAARPVLGEIGLRLTDRNPRWAASAPLDPTDRTPWDEGDLPARLAWLRARRRIDPDGARDSVQEGFSRESAPTRAELLAALAENLGPGDQDLLLAAVGDRSRAVSTVAMGLLTRLPDSPLRQHLRTLLGRHLVVRRRLLRTTVTLTDPAPPEFAPWPAPDGDPWTALLGRVDPDDWTRVLGADLLPLVGGAELRPLHPGLRTAAVTFGHAPLARALVADTLACSAQAPAPAVDAALWAVLAPDDLVPLFDRLLADHRLRPGHLTPLLESLPRPWPTGVGQRLAGWLPTSGTVGIPAARPLWDALARATALADCRAAAALARQVAERATGDQAPTVVTRASAAATVLTLRAVLYDALPDVLSDALRPPEGTR